MKYNFDTIWDRCQDKNRAHKCPLSDEQMDSHISMATDSQTSMPQFSYRNRTSRVWPAAVAACIVLLALPLAVKSLNTSPDIDTRTVRYNGRNVTFACNNACNAQGIMNMFDAYLNGTEI